MQTKPQGCWHKPNVTSKLAACRRQSAERRAIPRFPARGGALTIRQSYLRVVVNTLLRFRPCPEASAPELMTNFRSIKSPVALATCGMFLVPEPLGSCLLLAAAVSWLWRYTG